MLKTSTARLEAISYDLSRVMYATDRLIYLAWQHDAYILLGGISELHSRVDHDETQLLIDLLAVYGKSASPIYTIFAEYLWHIRLYYGSFCQGRYTAEDLAADFTALTAEYRAARAAFLQTIEELALDKTLN